MSAKFVLIHGTWHGGWAWQGVVRHLSHRVTSRTHQRLLATGTARCARELHIRIVSIP